MRNRIGTGLVLGWIAALALAGKAVAQDFDDVRITASDLGGGVHMLAGAGGNLAVSGGRDGVFLVDDQYAPLTEKIRAAVARIDSGPVRFVLNTHWHADHTGGNENLGGSGSLIVAHDAVRERMSTDQFIAAFDRKVPASPAVALPVVTFADDVTFHLNGQAIHAFHVHAAHTDGDAVVHFRGANVVHTGDVFFQGRYPFIDLSSGGSLDGLIAGVERILTVCDDATRIIPGHGAAARRADLEAYRTMLVVVRGRVAAAIEAGKGADALVAARPTADLDPEWGGGFVSPEAFLRTAHASLSGG